MGFFKKIFRPISKVLDKVIPNELKPALPYLAAFAPYMLPGTGIFASMAGRGFGSAAANLVGQLAQEGNEGEVNPLSLLLSGVQGAATAPGAGDTFRGMINKGKPEYSNIPGGNMPGQGIGGFNTTYDTSGLTGLDKFKNFMYKGGAKLSDLAGDAKDILQNPFDEGVTLDQITSAGATPFSQASGDVIYGEAVRQKKDYEREEARRLVEEEMRQRGLDQSYIDSIIASMTAYGYTQEEIDAILELQGYEGLAEGGRVGARQGGILESLINSGPTQQLPAQPTRPLGSFQPFLGRPLQQAQAVFPRLNQLEQGVNQAEQSLGSIRERLGNQPNQLLSASQGPMPQLLGLQQFNNPFLQSQAPVGTLRGREELYKEGGRIGLMDGGEADFISMSEVVENVGDDKMNEGIMQMAELDEGKQLLLSKKYIELLREYSERGLPDADSRALTEANEFVREIKLANGGSVLPPGMEMDYRGGGMIPMGSKERADDVPARVSKNEFVMTADAVRAAGGGSVNKGAQRMYQLMNNLEARA